MDELIHTDLLEITKKILGTGSGASVEEARMIADLPHTAIMDIIFCADKIRKNFVGDEIFTCTIVNAKSGRCNQDCAFCAQSAYYDTGISIYPLMDKSDLVAAALKMAEAGATQFSFVTSGIALSDKEIDIICLAASEIKAKTNLEICCSVGLISHKQAKRLKDAGISRYHHNLETARSFFTNICTTHTYDADVDALITAKDAGLLTCSGGIFGLGETWEHRIELAYTLKEINIDRIPVNFLTPIPKTPLEKRPLMSVHDSLKTIALLRFIHPKRGITVCGGRVQTLKDLHPLIFLAGANGVMTGDYLTTTGRDIKNDMKMLNNLYKLWGSLTP